MQSESGLEPHVHRAVVLAHLDQIVVNQTHDSLQVSIVWWLQGASCDQRMSGLTKAKLVCVSDLRGGTGGGICVESIVTNWEQ